MIHLTYTLKSACILEFNFFFLSQMGLKSVHWFSDQTGLCHVGLVEIGLNSLGEKPP